MAIRIDKNSEEFKILQENISSARGKQFTADETENLIKKSKRLSEIYKNISKTLKETNELYKKNREVIGVINDLNDSNLKKLNMDKVTRQAINDINRRNLKYLDETQETTRQSLLNDIESEKIKARIQEINKSINRSEREKNTELEKYNKTFMELSDFASKNGGNFKIPLNEIEDKINKLRKYEDAFRSDLEKYASETNPIIAELHKESAERTRNDVTNLIAEINKNMDVMDASGGTDFKATDKLRLKFSDFIEDMFNSSNIMVNLGMNQRVASDENMRLSEEQKRAEKTEEAVGKIGKIFDGLAHTPLNSIIDFRGAKNKLSDSGAIGDSVNMTAMKHLMSETIFSKMGAMGLGVYAFKEIVELMAKADTRLTSLAKSFTVSKEEAGGIYQNIEDVTNELGTLGVNMDDIVNAQIKFNEEFGYAVNLSKTMLADISQSNKLLGLSAESVHELISQSFTTSTNVRDIQRDILGTIMLESEGLITSKGALEQVLNISGEVRANFRNNVSEIAKAVVKSKELGISMEKVNMIGEGLLDFEGSLNAELQAELLTNRELNLEKARYYALTGDTLGLMEEINKNVGNFDEFTSMNVLQQNAFAKAVGMSREEMSNMLFEQQVNAELIKTGNKAFNEESRSVLSQSEKFKSGFNRIMQDATLSQVEKQRRLGEYAINNLSALDAQQKFEESLTKIKEKIAQLFGDGAVLDKMANGIVHFLGTIGLIDERDVRNYDVEDLTARQFRGTSVSRGSDEYQLAKDKLSILSDDEIENLIQLNKIEDSSGKDSKEYKSQLLKSNLSKEGGIAETYNIVTKNIGIEVSRAIADAMKNITIQMDSTKVGTAFNKGSGK